MSVRWRERERERENKNPCSDTQFKFQLSILFYFISLFSVFLFSFSPPSPLRCLLLPTVFPLWNFFHTSFTNCGSDQFPPPLYLFIYLFAVGLFLLVGPFLWRAGGGRRKDFEDEKCGATPFYGAWFDLKLCIFDDWRFDQTAEMEFPTTTRLIFITSRCRLKWV